MNAAQTKHLVGTLRAVALTQLVAFGYSSFAKGDLSDFVASIMAIVASELFCLFLLRGFTDEKI